MKFISIIMMSLFLAGCTKAAFVGDSITYLMSGDLPADQTSVAVPGYTTSQMLSIELPQALALTPLAVPILGGTNDVLRGLRSIEDLKSMSRQARASGSCVILATLPPCDHPACERSAFDAWNRQVLDFAQQEKYPVADYRRAMSDGSGAQLPGLFYDQIHPNADGVKIMLGVIQPLIASCPNVISAGYRPVATEG